MNLINVKTRILLTIFFISAICLAFPNAAFAQSDKSVNRETPIVLAVRSAKDAVVNISTNIVIQSERENNIFQHFFPELRSGPRTTHSLGSGFIIHSEGYIITNAHVVKQANEILVTFSDGTSVKADAWYTDDHHDLAVIKIKTDKPLPVLPFGRGDDLMIGETVIAIGNALGYKHSVTTGVVSAVGRTLDFRSGETYRNLIQTDASINPGNSGGPLLNIEGKLIGINTAIRGDAQNIGFAINVDVLNQFIPGLLSAQSLRRIELGFKLMTTSQGTVRVLSVDENSPALKAGLLAGDIITHYNGRKIKNSIDLYVSLLEHSAGDNLKLRVQRGKVFAKITMPFKEKPKPNGKALAKTKLGLVLAKLSPKNAARMNLSNRSYLIVQDVLPGYEAAELGIKKGDIINSLGSSRIKTFDELGQILEQVSSGQKISLAIFRVKGSFIYSATTPITIR